MDGIYSDHRIECTPDAVVIRGYYFPWGSKHVRYASIKSLRRVQLTASRGQWRIWGTANFKYWANLDAARPHKETGFVIDLGRGIQPFVTPDDPDAFEAAVRQHVELGEPGIDTTKGPVL
jgi:hypothetical protein